jgi:two-component system C4-dicarboxylate transport sensor histidine kinase DctB
VRWSGLWDAQILLLNARDATVGDPVAERRVALGARAREKEVEITVTENGGGISAEVLSRLFEPFFTMKPVGQGAGLGLAI